MVLSPDDVAAAAANTEAHAMQQIQLDVGRTCAGIRAQTVHRKRNCRYLPSTRKRFESKYYIVWNDHGFAEAKKFQLQSDKLHSCQSFVEARNRGDIDRAAASMT